MKISLCSALNTVLWLGLVFGMTRPTHAAFIAKVSGLRVTNPGGAIVATDATDGDPDSNRHGVMVAATVRFTGSGVAAQSARFRTIFQLQDESGNPVNLNDGAGGTVTSVTVEFDGGLPNSFGGVISADRDVNSVLIPITPLAPVGRYRVQVVLQRESPAGSGAFANQGTATISDLQAFLHFDAVSSADPDFHVQGAIESVTLGRTVLVRSQPGQASFTAEVEAKLVRFDDLGSDPTTDIIPVTLRLKLFDMTDPLAPAEVSLATNMVSFPISVATYEKSDGRSNPSVQPFDHTVSFAPANWLTFDPLRFYRLEVRLETRESDGVTVIAQGAPRSPVEPPSRLLGLSGKLVAGRAVTQFTAVANDPTSALLVPAPANDPAGGGWFSSQLAVAVSSGSYAPGTNRSYGDALPFQVDIFRNGDAVMRGDARQSFNVSGEDVLDLKGLRFVRTTLKLTARGIVAESLGLILPAGLGVTTSATSRRLLPLIGDSEVLLDENLLPPETRYTFTPPSGATWYACHESLPLRLKVGRIIWDRTEGTLTLPVDGQEWVRLNEHLRHEVGVRPNLHERYGNDGFYRFVNGVGPVTITTDANGKALLSTRLEIGPGFFTSHFPARQVVDWSASGKGKLELLNSVVAESSVLIGVQPATIRYNRGCSGLDCPGQDFGPGEFSFTPDQDTLFFTPDRGLRAEGNVTDQTLEWGGVDLTNGVPRFAHRTSKWSRAAWHMPGHAVGSSPLPSTDQPAGILLTGVGSPGRPRRMERPQTAGYEEGLADYAGLNFRTSDQSGVSILAYNETPRYQLTRRSKYYIRPGGVSGIHEAVALTPSLLKMYGFDVNLDGLRLAYLDSVNKISRTGGGVHIPDPVTPALGFDLQFKNLFFNCKGQPGACTLDTHGDSKYLDYWETDFTPLSMEFKQPVVTNCTVNNSGFISLGVETRLPAITSTPLFGEFGFQTNGNFVTEGIPLSVGTGVDSRLELPTNLEIAGPGSKPWKLTTASKAYFNNPEIGLGMIRPKRGFISFAGMLDLPWYQDCKVHIHASSSSRATQLSQQYLMGGWPTDPTKGPGDGWADGQGHHFFTDRNFDTNHYGFPQPLLPFLAPPQTVEDYRGLTNQTSPKFRPLGERSWLNTIDFSFPLKWQATTRKFEADTIQRDLLVLGNVHRSLPSLTPEIAELSFGAKYNGIPRLNTAKLLVGAIEGATGVIKDLSKEVTSILPITKAIQELDGLLAEQMARTLDAPLDQALEGPAQAIYASLGNDPAVEAQLANLQAALFGFGTDGAFTKDLNRRLTVADDGLTLLIALLESDGQPGQTGVGRIVKVLLDKSGIPGLPQIAEAAVNQVLGTELPKAIPQLESLVNALTAVRAQLRKAQSTTLVQVSAVFSSLNAAGGALPVASRAALNDIKSRYGTVAADVRWKAENPSHLVVPQLKRLIKERLLATLLVPKIQSVLKQNLADLHSSFRAAVDDLFGEINTLIRKVIEAQIEKGLAGFTDSIDSTVNDALGEISGKMGAAKVEGYAQINDESLRLLDLNGLFEFNLPDKIMVQAHFRIQEFDSDSPPSGCRDGATRLTEVQVDANTEIPWSKSPPKSLRIEVGSKITLQNDPPNDPKGKLVPKGFDGYFGLLGEIEIGPLVVNEVRLAAGMGAIIDSSSRRKDWAYIAAKARGRLDGYEVAAGVFFGRTCDLKVIADIDPEVGKALKKATPTLEGTLPLTGVYAYGEGWYPLVQASCFFQVRVGGGAGFFAFVNDQGRILVGSKQFLGVEGTALCIFSVRGEIKLVGLLDIPGSPPVPNGGLGSDLDTGVVRRASEPAPGGASLTLYGDGFIQGRFGPCPLCLKISKTLGITLKIGGGDTKMEVDF